MNNIRNLVVSDIFLASNTLTESRRFSTHRPPFLRQTPAFLGGALSDRLSELPRQDLLDPSTLSRMPIENKSWETVDFQVTQTFRQIKIEIEKRVRV
jgi:hypothetical protein